MKIRMMLEIFKKKKEEENKSFKSRWLKDLCKAEEMLQLTPFKGQVIPRQGCREQGYKHYEKRLKEFFSIDPPVELRRFECSEGRRIIYLVISGQIDGIIAKHIFIIDYIDHKEYSKIFGYGV